MRPIVLCAVFFTSIPLLAQSSSPERRDERTIVATARDAAVRAVNFRQGDEEGWKRGRRDFTAEGWTQFVKNMQGWLDDKGAPTFSSSFVPSGNPVVIGTENGVVHFRVPGTLTQTQNGSRTSYRAAIEVYAFRDLMIHGGEPIKIRHLEQITCGGVSTACQ
jgi:hypothetical protein